MNINEAKHILKNEGYIVEGYEKTSEDYFEEVNKFGDKYSDNLLNALWNYFHGEYDSNGDAFIRINGNYEPIESLTDLLYKLTYDDLVDYYGTPEQFVKISKYM